jgi:hypothetical protein
MNIMQFVYTNKEMKKLAASTHEPYREIMSSVVHDLLCKKDDRFTPIRFRVINGEPYSEWVEHTSEEWIALLNELGLDMLERMTNDVISELRKRLRGNDGEQRS